MIVIYELGYFYDAIISRVAYTCASHLPQFCAIV